MMVVSNNRSNPGRGTAVEAPPEFSPEEIEEAQRLFQLLPTKTQECLKQLWLKNGTSQLETAIRQQTQKEIEELVTKLRQEADKENQVLRQALLDAKANTLAHQVLALQEEVNSLKDTIQERQSQINRLEYDLQQQRLRHETAIQELQQNNLSEDEHVRTFRQFGGQLDRFYHERAREEIGDIAQGIHTQLATKVGRSQRLKLDQHLVDFLEGLPLGSPDSILQKEEHIAVSSATGTFVNLDFKIPSLKTPINKQKFKEQIIREEAELKRWHVSAFHWISLGHLLCTGADMNHVVDVYMLGLLYAYHCVGSSLQFRSLFELKGKHKYIQDRISLSTEKKSNAIDIFYSKIETEFSEQNESVRKEKEFLAAVKGTRRSQEKGPRNGRQRTPRTENSSQNRSQSRSPHRSGTRNPKKTHRSPSMTKTSSTGQEGAKK